MNNELDFLIYREPDGDANARATIDGELKSEATVSKMEIVQDEGGRKVKRMVDFYNLDAKGKISAEHAKAKAEAEYDSFNKTQKILSDFEKISVRAKGVE